MSKQSKRFEPRTAISPAHAASRWVSGLAAARAALSGEGEAVPADQFFALQQQWQRDEESSASLQGELPLR